MREVDRLAVEDFGIGILQMMENAGRNLAMMAMDMLSSADSHITILAGSGGNGGGGICCARHLLNRGYKVKLVLSKDRSELRGAVIKQLNIILQTGFQVTPFSELEASCASTELIIDAIIGYSLSGNPAGKPLEMIQACNHQSAPKLSLDIPSGIDATTGNALGEFVKANHTLTLALPKQGLTHPDVGELFLGDLGIPPRLYQGIDIQLDNFFGGNFIIPLNVN
ncbi:MAG: NAD(P)H-hydrate epimerase [Chloroflexota bacterium]